MMKQVGTTVMKKENVFMTPHMPVCLDFMKVSLMIVDVLSSSVTIHVHCFFLDCPSALVLSHSFHPYFSLEGVSSVVAHDGRVFHITDKGACLYPTVLDQKEFEWCGNFQNGR
jgi:hypothetical protein